MLTAARAEQLPVRVYTSADGPGQNRVKRIVDGRPMLVSMCRAACRGRSRTPAGLLPASRLPAAVGKFI